MKRIYLLFVLIGLLAGFLPKVCALTLAPPDPLYARFLTSEIIFTGHVQKEISKELNPPENYHYVIEVTKVYKGIEEDTSTVYFNAASSNLCWLLSEESCDSSYVTDLQSNTEYLFIVKPHGEDDIFGGEAIAMDSLDSTYGENAIQTLETYKERNQNHTAIRYGDIDYDDIFHEYLPIEYATFWGITSGYPDGTFRPNNSVNRAELTKIIINANFDQNEIDNCLANDLDPEWSYVFFPDVPRDSWYAKYVCTAKMNNIINGYPDGTFKPSSPVNFTEAAKMIINGFGYSVEPDPTWFVPYVMKIDSFNAIPRSINSFDKRLTRRETVEIIHSIQTYFDYISAGGGYDSGYPRFKELANSSQPELIQTPSVTFDENIWQPEIPYFVQVNNRLYYRSVLLKDIDLNSTVILPFLLLKDENHVYRIEPGEKNSYELNIITEANPDTFEFIEDSGWIVDQNDVFYATNSSFNHMSAADRESFEFLNVKNTRLAGDIYLPFAVDKNHVYFGKQVLADVDRATFEHIGFNYFKDKDHVYYESQLVKGADPDTFEALNSYSGKDKDYSYSFSQQD